MKQKGSPDELIASAIRHLPMHQVPLPVMLRLVAFINRPRYNLGHLLVVIALLYLSPLVLSFFLKWVILSPSMQAFIFSLFGILVIATATILTYLMLLRRQTVHSNYGKKINALIDSINEE